ncbi:hypothetical protein [Planomonospora venezuelensis]|uniref:Uncharacterized protein n=1 Tax=Planomonospora venezuelensis TaxID=1999 RepID=A0A841D414_PLAVE|nr:hypothetical protein [Planomonospora venezuelensis]MBB5964991.1 hypothetical protein [Planomonospora venezuelensis]
MEQTVMSGFFARGLRWPKGVPPPGRANAISLAAEREPGGAA